jgi:acid phosphatase (class A)
MKRTILAAGLLLALVGAVQAAALSPIDPSRLLPPPPAAGSPDTLAEIAELHAIAARSTPEMLAAAARDANDQTPDIFNAVLGFDVTALPATKKLLLEVVAEDRAELGAAKEFFHRARPYAADPTIKTCVPVPPVGGNDSYPSGHTTLGFSLGEVLAALLPDKSQIILARAQEYGHNRLVCGFHFPSDTVGGQMLGTVIALRLMDNPTFKADFDGAEAELAARKP